MKKYDALVVGSGSAMVIVEEFLNHGYKVALVDRGPLGGTCLNVGCIPSKMLIYPADRILEIEEAAKLGIKAAVKEVDFKAIMTRMRQTIATTASGIREGIKQTKGLAFYEGEGYFVADYTIKVNDQKIKGSTVFLVSGTRPDIPCITGLDKISYLTNESLLELDEKPASLIIIGGGSIGVEYAHFFAAIGTKVILLELAERLIWDEEEEIATLLKSKLSKRMVVETGVTASEVIKENDGVTVKVIRNKDGAKMEFKAEKLMLATGRRSNADTLNLEKTGVKTSKYGYIEVDELYQTSKKGIFSCGDAIGKQMFINVANREALLLANSVLHSEKINLNYNAAPHAIFSHPQVASVGLTEVEAKRKGYKILVGKANYTEIAKGQAMMEEDSFAKAVVDKKSGKILGFHIIGPCAPTLIQEVVSIMVADGKAEKIYEGIHIHPALSELIPVTLSKLTER